MKAEKARIGKKVRLRRDRKPLAYNVTLPKDTTVQVDKLTDQPGLFWAKVKWEGQKMRFPLDCSEVDD